MPRTPAIKPNSKDHVEAIRAAYRFKDYIEGVEHRGIKLSQLQQVTWWATENCYKWRLQLQKGSRRAPLPHQLCMHEVKMWLIEPACEEKFCSFVELLSRERQTPDWFACHWWRGPVVDFLKCLQLHAQTRDPDEEESLTYWVCAYANRLEREGAAKLPFDQEGVFKAMQIVQGLLVTIDEQLDDSCAWTPAERLWCVFEAFVAVERFESQGKIVFLDIAAMHGSRAELLTSGLTKKEQRAEEQTPSAGTWAKECREKAFPLQFLQRALTTDVMQAKTSIEEDRASILKYLAGLDMGLKQEETVGMANYCAASGKVRAEFAIAAWRRALLEGPETVASLNLSEVLAADMARQVLSLDFLGCEDEMSDSAVATLARGISPKLTKLELSFVRCCLVSSKGVEALSRRLPRTLQELMLDFSFCGDIGDPAVQALRSNMPEFLHTLRLRFKAVRGTIGNTGIKVLGGALPENLRVLELDFGRCDKIADKGVEALSEKLPASLESLHLDFWMCGDIGDDGAESLGKHWPPALQNLYLRITGARKGGGMSDRGVRLFCKRLPDTLKSLRLDFLYLDKISDGCMEVLGHHISACDSMETLQLRFEGCDKISDVGMMMLFEKVPEDLKSFQLHFEFCVLISNAGLSFLAEKLPTQLRYLHLNFGSVREISDSGIVALAEKLPKMLQLRYLHLDVKFCKKIGDLGVSALGRCIPESVQTLSLQFGYCELIYDHGLASLAQGFPPSMHTLDLNLWQCKNVGDTGIMAVARSLPELMVLLKLNVEGTKVSPDKKHACKDLDDLRICAGSAEEMGAPMEQPMRAATSQCQLFWIRRHGPPLEGIDQILNAKPLHGLKSPSRSARQGMSKSESCPTLPTLKRKQPPMLTQSLQL